MKLVLDASATLAWIFPDEFDDLAAAQLDLVSRHGAVTSPLWHLEVCNALVAAERRGRFAPARSAEAWAILDSLPLEDAELDPPEGELLALARAHRLSAYDASYLWLAQRTGSTLCTRDAALAAAATATGVALV